MQMKTDLSTVVLEKEVSAANVSLTLVELTALEQWTKRRFKEGNIHDAARFAIWFALLHPEQMDDWLQAVSGYEIAEGLNQFKHVRGQIAARYRTKRLKLQTGGAL